MARTRRGCLMSLAKVYLGGALLLALSCLSTYGLTWWQLRDETEAWANELGPSGLAAAVPPRAEPNGTTRRVQALVEPLGIDLLTYRKLTPEVKEVIDFVAAEQGSAADDDAEVPQPVRALLEVHAGRLTAIETLLTESAPPTWASDPALFYREPAPSAVGPRGLWALLLAHASDEARRGRPATARLALAAAGRLQEGLQGRTQTVFQILAAASSVARSGVRRRLQADLGDAEDAIGDLRAQGERLLAAPYLRWCAVDYSRHVRALVRELEADDPCHVDTDAVNRRAMSRVSRWSMLARIGLRNAASRWDLLAKAELEDELTRVVVDTRLRPPEAGDAIASRVCRGLEWNRLPDGAGGVLIEAGVANRLPRRADDAPWRYQVSPAAGPLSTSMPRRGPP